MTASDGVDARRSTIDPGSSLDRENRPSGGDGPSTHRGRASEADRPPVTVYRWTCPICGESRTGMASGHEDPRAKAAFSLRQHVQTSDGDGHGQANRYPPGFDPDAADGAVSVD